MMEPLSPGLDGRFVAQPLRSADGGASSNLAALLDRFTCAISNPEDETVGGFAQTVEQLHGELAMLAGHFRAQSVGYDPVDFDVIFPDGAVEAIIEPGLAASEELEHLCGQLSR
jgi:hypothetical protein